MGVVWNGALSDYFLATNGVLSINIFSIYTDGLFLRLRNANVDCYVGTFFVGALHRERKFIFHHTNKQTNNTAVIINSKTLGEGLPERP